jgi:hypothetical protein
MKRMRKNKRMMKKRKKTMMMMIKIVDLIMAQKRVPIKMKMMKMMMMMKMAIKKNQVKKNHKVKWKNQLQKDFQIELFNKKNLKRRK